MKSDATGCVIEICRKEDIASRGAFLLGAVGCKWCDSISDVAIQLYEQVERERVVPDAERSRRHEEIYRECYLTQFSDGINSL